MFSKDQIEALYLVVEKGVITAEDAGKFLKKKLQEAGVEITPPAAPEQPAAPEPTPPTPEAPAQPQA